MRLTMPRFQEPNISQNRELIKKLSQVCAEINCSLAQIAIAWLLAQGEHVLPIPGTVKIDHLEDDLGAASVTLSAEILSKLDDLFQPEKIHGFRYPALGMSEVDTESFACEQ
jgi:aryl-alcohol dehydrogenase-like predicted oxidoreductase